MLHHPIFQEFAWSVPRTEGDVSVNVIGARQRIFYDAGVVPNARQFEKADDARFREAGTLGVSISTSRMAGQLPRFDEEYFEWIDILESVSDYASRDAGRRPYVFAELGAGFGRWTVNAVQALRQICPSQCEYYLCAVEADAQHFEWLKQNLQDNEIDPEKQLLLNAPLTGDGRQVSFLTGAYGREFGQAVINDHLAYQLRATGTGLGKLMLRWIAPLRRRYQLMEDKIVQRLKSITFGDVLRSTPHVIDIADLDLQGMEAEVIESALPLMGGRVMRLHIGTHSHEVEERLRKCLHGAGWTLLRDYPCLGSRDTPFGRVAFGDGVQSWINPRFERR